MRPRAVPGAPESVIEIDVGERTRGLRTNESVARHNVNLALIASVVRRLGNGHFDAVNDFIDLLLRVPEHNSYSLFRKAKICGLRTHRLFEMMHP
jgi:hypothetical protein